MTNRKNLFQKGDIDRFDLQQWFPTYKFIERDIALAEYQASVENLLSEEKVFTSSASIAVLGISAIGSVLIGADPDAIDKILKLAQNFQSANILFLLNLLFATTFILYFASRIVEQFTELNTGLIYELENTKYQDWS